MTGGDPGLVWVLREPAQVIHEKTPLEQRKDVPGTASLGYPGSVCVAVAWDTQVWCC